jgi:hypothetical protein
MISRGRRMLSKSEQLKDTRFRKRKCKTCKESFRPTLEGQLVCTVECSLPFGKEQNAKQIKKEKREFKQSDKSTLMKSAQFYFNKFIRTRDKGDPCISCGHQGNRQIHAGHFMPVGANGHIRFDEANCHAQCSICNNHKSGNLSEYEPRLVVKVGQEEVNRLKRKITRSYDVDELKHIIETYKTKTKELNGL